MSRWLKTWREDHVLWVEAFAVFNLAFLVLDIYIAHAANAFRHWVEYIPLYFSMVAPLLLVVGMLARYRGKTDVWVLLGHVVGWSSLAVGLAGVLFHLES